MVDYSSFETTPDDPQVLLELSNQCATENLHDTAVIFADTGLKLPSDHITKTKLLEQISISGFYSKSQNRSINGKEACEILATDRRNSWHTKNLARQNSTYYAKSATDIMPSTVLQQVNYTPADDYRPMNPSITNKDSEIWMIQRTVNYTIRPDGSYDMRGDSAIRTRNILIQLNKNKVIGKKGVK